MSSREIEVEITKKPKSKEDKNFAPYAPKEELGIYKATRWTWREKQEAVMKASTTLDADKGLIEMNLIDFQAEQMLSCITPPEGLEWTKERIEKLDPDVGDIVLDACRRVNGTTLSERKDFLEKSDSTEATPG